MATLPTHKNTLTYLEHCRIVMADERLCYVKAQDAVEKHFSLPYANSNILLLGPGTSLTHQAARLLGDEGVCIAFTGGGGTPLYMTSVNEYRPTEYMQGWCRFWYSEDARLRVAKLFQKLRCDFVEKTTELAAVRAELELYRTQATAASNNEQLLLAEARFSKKLYRHHSEAHNLKDYVRSPRAGTPLDDFLDAGNYMAYGMAACALWVLGISFAFGVNHGMTRRGALVFDVADIIKDAIILPSAFKSFALSETPQQARYRVLLELEHHAVLKLLLNAIVQGIEEGLKSDEGPGKAAR